MRSIWALACLSIARAACALRLMRIEPVTVRTTLRLWHDLHVAAATAYDFEHLFEPAREGHEFVAAVLNDEVHALARCEVDLDRSRRQAAGDGWRLEGVAHSPHGSPAAAALVRMLASDGVRAHPQLRDRQPRWSVAVTFYARR